MHLDLYIMTSFLTSQYFSMVLTKEHCTEIVKLNYRNQTATTFVQTMNERIFNDKAFFFPMA